MTRLIIDISRYVLFGLILIYSIQSFLVFVKRDEESREFLFLRQNVVMFCIHFVAFMVLYLRMEEPMLLFFYGAQVIYLAATLVFYRNLYPKASKLLVNNMCMLITVGFIMVTRLSYDDSIQQFKMLIAGTVVSLAVPGGDPKGEGHRQLVMALCHRGNRPFGGGNGSGRGDGRSEAVAKLWPHRTAALGVHKDYLRPLRGRNAFKVP